MTNIEEYAANTDPKNAGSRWRLHSATKTGASFTVSFEAEPDRRYDLQRLVPAPGATWAVVATLEPSASASMASLTDPAAPPDSALYRVRAAVP